MSRASSSVNTPRVPLPVGGRRSPILTVVVLVSLLLSFASAFPHATNNRENEFVPNSYIIQLGSSSSLAKRGLTPQGALSQVLGKLQSKGVNYDLTKQYTAAAFNGAAIKVPDGVSQEDILALDGVERVWRNRIYHLPVQPASVDSSSSQSNTAQVPLNLISAFIAAFQKIFAGLFPYAGDTWGPHVQTGIDQLHNVGILGQGVKVCVIDGGLDYKNPILGGCFGPGCLISFGYDFVGDNYSPVTNNPTPGPDPYATCTDHGSHVTGIIAALANQYGFSGVAPKATFGHYRVFGCALEATSDDIVLSALIRAQADGCQVINLSLYAPVGWASVTPSEMMIDSLVQSGVHVSIATGNDGAEGLFYAEYPSSAINSVSVGSIDVASLPTYRANLNGGLPPIAYMSAKPIPANGTYGVVFTSTDGSTTSDGCNALPMGSLAGKVAVIKRGTCTFDTKIGNAAAAGAVVVFIYNSANNFMLPQLGPGPAGVLGVGGLTNEAGVKLLSYYNANPTGLQMTFPSGPTLPASSNIIGVQDKYSGGLVSYFSGYSPSFDMFGQPAVTAPGSNILSTIALANGGVGILQGTSQATPLVAGAIALIISARSAENLTPFQVRSLLATTANRVPTTYNGSTPDSVVLQGAGTVNVARAVAARTLLAPYQFMLNDTAYANYQVTLTLQNKNLYPVQYSFSTVGSQALAHYTNSASGDIVPSTTPIPVTATASASFSKNKVTVPAFQTTTVTITFTPPALSAADAARFPIYSGFVTVNGRALGFGSGLTESYTVPYFGLAAKMIDMPILDTTNTFLGVNYPFLGLADGNIAAGGETISQADGVTILFRLAGGTRSVTVDLVTADTVVNTTVPSVTNPMRLSKRAVIDLAATSSPNVAKRAPGTLYSDIPTVGRIYTNLEVPRDGAVTFTDTEYLWNGAYSDANNVTTTAAVNTPYRVLLRVLKITADPTLESSYESWLSPEFTFTA